MTETLPQTQENITPNQPERPTSDMDAIQRATARLLENGNPAAVKRPPPPMTDAEREFWRQRSDDLARHGQGRCAASVPSSERVPLLRDTLAAERAASAKVVVTGSAKPQPDSGQRFFGNLPDPDVADLLARALDAVEEAVELVKSRGQQAPHIYVAMAALRTAHEIECDAVSDRLNAQHDDGTDFIANSIANWTDTADGREADAEFTARSTSPGGGL